MTGPKEALSIPAIATLIDDLRSEDQKKRINSFENLGIIARTLGPERTRNELLPFLLECSEDDDEVLVILAEALGDFIDLVGGTDQALSLLKPLEPLVCAEESIVRNKVNSTIIKLGNREHEEIINPSKTKGERRDNSGINKKVGTKSVYR